MEELYPTCPREFLSWRYRWRLIKNEIQHHRPDVVCLQEVDRFDQIQAELDPIGCVFKQFNLAQIIAEVCTIQAVMTLGSAFLLLSAFYVKDASHTIFSNFNSVTRNLICGCVTRYLGLFVKRSGSYLDGCATFWCVLAISN